jgi:hypothetical protein
MTKYVGDIELMSGLLRVFVEGAAIGEDPYEFVCAILWHDRTTVELKGVKPGKRLPFVAMRSAVVDRLCELGVKEVSWIRKNRGVTRQVRMSIPWTSPEC